MRQKFCPKCGKIVDRVYGSLCKDCYLEEHSIIEKFPDSISVERCKDCGKYVLGEQPTFELVAIVERKLKSLLKNRLVKNWFIQKTPNFIKLTLVLKTEGLKKSESKTIRLIFDKALCKYCTWKRGGRFEAILQLRFREELKSELKDLVKESISTANLYDPQAFITRAEESRNRLNFRVGSKKAAEIISEQIKKKYGAKIKKSRQLVGMKKGKKLYRLTIAVIIQ